MGRFSLTGQQLTLRRALVASASGPACVKTRTSGEGTELFSPFASCDGDCQCCCFSIQCNLDKISTRKFDIGVFTQPGSKPEKLNASKCFPLYPQERTFAAKGRFAPILLKKSFCRKRQKF
jgi:hypothetical protein